MRENKQPTRKYNPICWDSIKDREIRSFSNNSCCLKASEFVKRIKTNPGFYDEEVILARDILMQLCRRGPHTEAKIAKKILEKAGYDKRIIPEEAYVKNRTDDEILRSWQTHLASFIGIVEVNKKRIEPLFEGKKAEDDGAIKEAFRLIVKRDMTLEEMKALKRKQAFRSITELTIFLWVCIVNTLRQEEKRSLLSFDTLRELYYSPEASQERKELDALNDVWRYLIRKAQVGLLGFLAQKESAKKPT